MDSGRPGVGGTLATTVGCGLESILKHIKKNNYLPPPVQLVQYIHKPVSKSTSCTEGSLERQRSAALTVCSRPGGVALCREGSGVFHRAHCGNMQAKRKMQTKRESSKSSNDAPHHCQQAKSNFASNKDTQTKSRMPSQEQKCRIKKPCVLLNTTVNAGSW